MSARLAVIIVTWNVRSLLEACLRSLIAALGDTQARIIVVDNASTDGTPQWVRAAFPQVHLIANTENLGYARANNQALRAVLEEEARFAWLLNPDTIVHPGAPQALLRFMEMHPRCGLCGPKLLNPDGSLQHSAFALPGLMQLLLETQPWLWRFRDTWLDGRYAPQRYKGAPFRVGHPLGAAMLARIDAVRAVGLLDEQFEMYCEEIDWAVRMQRAGWEVWCVPEAVATHYGGASSKQASARAERLKWQSRQRYYRKH
ncbi:MAG: glycosyltransferase family 2 protein, partial [Thermoflexales bacterium]|nr:glycosyltransferase family 2 protein [Thermoflexales bacterium]